MDINNPFSIEDEVYKETYDKTYRFLYAGMTGNVLYDIHVLLQTIDTLTTYYGNNQHGRGSLSQTHIEAEIAASEVVLYELMELKKEQTRIS